MSKKLLVPGAVLWIAGLVMSTVGLNTHTDTGSLIAVIGNILFLLGLGMVGAAWMIARKKEDENREE